MGKGLARSEKMGRGKHWRREKVGQGRSIPKIKGLDVTKKERVRGKNEVRSYKEEGISWKGEWMERKEYGRRGKKTKLKCSVED